MFDFDIGKMIVFGIVALAVIPPKDLPRVMRTVGNYVGKMRRMASDFQGQFMDAMKEVELESVRNEIEEINKAAKLETSFDPVSVMRTEMTNSIEPPKAVQLVEAPGDPADAGLVSTAVNAIPLKAPEPAVDVEPLADHEVAGPSTGASS